MMKETWAFDIGSDKFYSTKAFAYGAVNYLAKVIPDSFSGVHMQIDIVSKLYAPNTAEFDISNTDGVLGESDFQDKQCRIGQVLDGVLCRQWNMVIQTAVEANGKIHCSCVDYLSRNLKGDFPNTPSVPANFPSENVVEDKEARVPITLGTAFIPCAPFLTGGDQYFCLGKTGYTYTINKVRSPRNYELQSEWDNSYTYTQSNKTGAKIAVRGVTLSIADDPDGPGYVTGIWTKNGVTLAPLIEFAGPLSTIHYPGKWIKEIIQMFGVNIGALDTSTFDACRTSVSWGGGFWRAESKESLLSSLLLMCDCFISCEAYLKLNEFSKTPVETIDASKIKSLSFSPSKMTKSENDGGHVRFAWDGEPQDELTGEAVVGLYASQTVMNNPSNDVFEYRFGYDNTEAQAFGVLYFQKKYDQKYAVSFSTTMDKLATRATLVPGQVITVYNITSSGLKNYGASKNIVITSIHFKPDLSVVIEGSVYNHLEQYSDMAFSEIVPDTASGGDFEFNSLTKLVTVTGQNVFHFVGGSLIPDETSITLTASLFGGLTTYDWEYWTGAVWANLSGTQNAATYDLDYDNIAWNGYTLRVRCLSGDYYGEITITKIYDGIDGLPGTPGTAGEDGPGVVYVGEYNASPGSGQFAWPKVFYNNANRRDIIKYSGTYYIYNFTDGYNETSWILAHWETFGATFKSVATDILLAQDVAITRSLTFSGGASYLNVTGADGLKINAAGGLQVLGGADIAFNTVLAANPSKLSWYTGSSPAVLRYAMGVDYANTKLFIAPDVAGYGNFVVGRGNANAIAPFDGIGLYANTSAYFGLSGTNNYLNVSAGYLDLYAVANVRVNSPAVIPIANGVSDIGVGSYKWRDLYLSRNIGAISYPVPGAYITSLYGDWVSPTRAAFLATKSASQAISGATNTLITFNSEPFDVGADFAASTFVAPVTGKYALTATIIISAFNMVTPDTYIRIWIQTSNRSYYAYVDPRVFDFSGVTHTLTIHVDAADMDVSDSAAVYTSSSTNGYTIYGSAQGCFFSGTLVN